MRLLAEGAGDVACPRRYFIMDANALLQILTVEHLPALLVDDLALGVHDVVVFQDVLSGLIVAALDGLLCVFDRAGEDLCVDGRILVDAERLHHVHDALGAEQAHDIVLQARDRSCVSPGSP